MVVETDLFEHRDVKPHFINPCCFGEDFAEWLRQKLLRYRDLGMKLSEPVQEDYGWGLWASNSKDRFWIALSYVGSGPQEAPAQFIISVNLDRGFNVIKRLFHRPDEPSIGRLQSRIHEILASNPAIKVIKNWDPGM